MLDRHSTQSANVLIVDDEPHVREFVKRSLSREGIACAEAGDYACAWTHLRRHIVDLVTLDVNLPGRSGIELLKHIHDAFPEVAVVLLTAVEDVDTAILALTHGARGFLTKPIDTELLTAQVNRCLEWRRNVTTTRRRLQQLEDEVRNRNHTIVSDSDAIRRLTAASLYRDEETGAHMQRVGLSSAILAKAAGWADADVDRIRRAAPAHDVGKIGIPDAILQKPGKLTDDEFELMKSHTAIGANLLAGSGSPTLEMASEIALYHHERWDASGYLQGLGGTDIPQSARIVAIVDVYDALTHDRVYRPAFEAEKAMEIMIAERGSHFDPELFDLFVGELSTIQQVAELVTEEHSPPSYSSSYGPSGIRASAQADERPFGESTSQRWNTQLMQLGDLASAQLPQSQLPQSQL